MYWECRSPMAEGWARQLWPDAIDAYSAGVKPIGLNPTAVRVMAEAGFSILAAHYLQRRLRSHAPARPGPRENQQALRT
jgi:protein-tyrosine-phosphatase